VAEVPAFGANPGDLTMKLYVPAAAPPPGGPLLVLLHGCGQDASDFADAAGWPGRPARRAAAAEQVARNNQGRCFNWFERGDIARDDGRWSRISIWQGRADADRSAGSRKTLRALITRQ
jgi:poly(3-hydroxybutyrate) depolymerase